MYSFNSDSCASPLRATKRNINPLILDAVAQVVALERVSFIHKNDVSNRVRCGFIAEDASRGGRSPRHL
jgi:hypothetical protein